MDAHVAPAKEKPAHGKGQEGFIVWRQEARAYRFIENGEMDVGMKYIKSQKYLVKMYIGMFFYRIN